MDPAPTPLDQRTSSERQISPESSSIRPNPFDDTDASSRKRRRTSASASLSPVTPADAGGSFDAADPTAERASTNSDLGPPLTENISTDDPSTPEQHSNGSGQDTKDPPSSQVTINIRRRSLGEDTEPSANNVNVIKNDIESNMTAPVHDMGCAQILSNENEIPDARHIGSSLGSPPTTNPNLPDEEKLEDDDEDDDMIITSVHEKTASPANVKDLIELTDQFPFREPGDDLLEALHRIVHYISSQPTIDASLPEQLSTWIRLCATYMECSDSADIIMSIKCQELFWLAFPSTIVAIRSRISTIASSQTLSYLMIDLLSAFAKLAEQMLKVDAFILSLVNGDEGLDTAELTLFCTEYLNQLHDALQIGDSFVQRKDEAEEVSPIWNHASVVRALLLPLETAPGNLTGWMEPLISVLNALVAQSRSHSITLTALTLVMADCLRESKRRLHMSGITPNVQSQIEDTLRRGQGYWHALSITFEHLIEKHISILNIDTAFAFVDGLTTMLEYCCPFDAAFLEDHLQLHPDTPVASLADAAAWEFRLQIFAKLIQSSHMQLRVRAVSTLCSDLIRIWKRRSDNADRETADFLRYLGTRLDDKVVDYVIGPTCHPEIIIESANVLGFLVVTKIYSQKHTDRLWAAILSSQDPRVGDALTRMVLTVCNLLEYETLLELCIKFQHLPLEVFSSTLRSLWESIIRELIAKRQGTQIPLTREPFISCLRMLRESARAVPGARVANVELHQSATQRLKELLMYGIDQPVRQELYETCIKDLRAKTDKTRGSLWFLSMSIRPCISAELQKLIEEYDLARLLVEELDCAVQTFASTERPVFSGHANHPRRDLIYNLIQIQPAAISGELSTKLWDLLVGALSRNTEDRVAAWQMLATVGRNSDYQNLFLQACFSQFLPKLPAACFSEGMLEIVKDNVSQLVNDPSTSILEDEELVSASPIEHLWRILLMGEEDSMVSSAIRALTSNVYLESRAIATLPSQRAQEIHVRLADRCLKQMETAARSLRRINDGSPSGDDDSMVFIASEEDTKTQERVFIRSLGILRYFMEAYRAKPQFSVPDMRSLIPKSTSEIKGDLAGLQYQSFDGSKQTDMKPLEIGKQNSAACLLARLRHETGFDNYRAFYRGQHFLPNCDNICKSLEELQINDGLILVKRAASDFNLPPRIRAGLSPLEIKILSHFNDLWEYLGMDEKLAKEVYNYLLKVPVDGGTMDLFDNTAMDYGAIFAPDQPYKTLYTIHAMIEYTATARSSDYGRDNASETSEPASGKHSLALRRALHLLVHALEDKDLAKNAPTHLKMQISCQSMMTFTRLLHDAQIKWGSLKQSNISGPSPQRLKSILQDALDCSTEEAVEWVASTLAAILRLSADNQGYWLAIQEDAAFADLLCRICVFDSRHRIRLIAVAMIEETVASECQVKDENKATASSDTPYLARFFWSLTLEVLPKAIRLGTQCQELLRLMQTLTTRLSCVNQLPMSLKPFAIQLVELLLNHTVTEDISELTPCDTVACGLVALLDLCAQIDKALPVSLPWTLMQSLLESKLFPRTRTRKDIGVPKIILNSSTRQKLYEFIFQHVRYDSSSLQATLGFLNNLTPFYPNDDEEPYIYDLPFQFDQARAIRAPCGYVGLRNLSNTCYLNSLLTQLYMNTDFRRFLLSFEVQDSEGSQKLLFSTQNLFGYVQDSYQRFVDTTSLVKTIKTYDDTMIDIHSQMDVDEFYNLLFDRWEGQLPNGASRRTLRSFYGGQLVQQVKSKECDHISERLEPFSAIQCDIKGKATLQDSLQAYVDGEIMEGDNKYKCSSCDNHVDAVKRACLKDIPDNMIFHLKRFDFNLRTLQRSKINDYFAFPETIDLQPYTIDFLSGESGARDKQDIFELVGVLVHSGTAESGHYYSYIRERPSQRNTSRWIEFNDDLVSNWDPGMLEDSTFGGTDRSAIYDANGIVYDKTYSAYMLFYQRAASVTSQEEALPPTSLLAPLRVEMNAALQQHIRDENILLLRRHCLFDQSHTRFVQACIGEATNPQESLATESEEKEKEPRVSHSLAVEVAVGHLDQVVSRAKDVPLFADFASLVHSQIRRCDDCALNFFVYFSERPAALRSLVQRNPDRNVRRETCKLFLAALDAIAAKLPSLYFYNTVSSPQSEESFDDEVMDVSNKDEDLSVLQGTVVLLDYLWRHFQVHIKSWDEYFTLVLDVAKRGRREAAQILAADYLARCLRIVSADAAMDLPSNFVRMLQNVYRRFATQPASYKAILALIDYLMRQLEPDLSQENIIEAAEERLKCGEGIFPWTSAEVNLVHYHPEQQNASIFIEKLLTIDQAHASAHSILERLVRSGHHMDQRISNTLRRMIQGDTTTEPLDPYMRAAPSFVDSTDSLDQAQRLIRHICAQAAGLQNNEGATFLEVFQALLDPQREEEEENGVLRYYATTTMPDWAPYLLVYPDGRVRGDAERLIEQELFQPVMPADGDSDMMAMEKMKALGEIALRLGTLCIQYFQDAHVKKRAQIERDTATEMIQVIAKCSQYVEMSVTLDEDSRSEFKESRMEVMTALRHFIVDEVEDDASDWEGSTFSSEAMDEAADTGTAEEIDQSKYVELMQGLSE